MHNRKAAKVYISYLTAKWIKKKFSLSFNTSLPVFLLKNSFWGFFLLEKAQICINTCTLAFLEPGTVNESMSAVH